MLLAFNYFSAVLFILGTFTVALATLAFVRSGHTLKWFGGFMLTIAVWAMGYGFELASPRLDQMLWWVKVEYIGITLLPALWLVFILRFIGLKKWITPLSLAAIFLFSTIGIGIVWTNDYHHLYYLQAGLNTSGTFPVKELVHGPWYIVHSLFFYLLLGGGLLLLLFRYRKADTLFRQQNRVVWMGAMIPWLVNFLNLLGFSPVENIDFTPFAFLFTAMFICIGLLRFNLMDIVPLARDKVLEVMHEGLVLTDIRGRIVDLNGTMASILSLSKSEIMGTSLQAYFDKPQVSNRLLSRTYEGDVDICWAHEDEDCYFEVTCKSLYEKNKVYSGRLFIFRDVTDYTHAKQKLVGLAAELQELNQLKDRLFSIISHDLRSPMATLSQLLELYQHNDLSEEDLKQLLPVLSNNLGYLNILLENLLQWSQAQLQGEVIDPIEYNLAEDVEHHINLFQNSFTQKKLRVQKQFNSHHTVYADREMIKLVIRNLLNNAIKFSREGDAITLGVKEENGHVVLSVKDTGIGISHEDQKKLFRMKGFSTAGTNSEKGTGLGLALSMDFVKKNQGDISVKSAPGKGSVFSFSLPMAP